MFDAHCDTLLKIMDGGSLHSNKYDVSFEKLATYGKAVQMFALFNNGRFKTEDILRGIELLKNEANKSPLAEFCVTSEDIDNNPHSVSVLSSLEGVGNTPDFKLDDVDKFYKAGVRIASITWNNDNPLCGGSDENKTGLTKIGRDVVTRMSRLGMVLDVSHISDEGFYDACDMDGVNIMATHSNSRTVCRHKRNLTDEQFKIIVKRGSVTGLNLYPEFINDSVSADVTDLIRHIEHFCSLGGEKNIGLGADFDGIDFKMSDINSCEKMNILFDELAKMNYTDKQIRSIYCENLMNFYRKMNFKH